MSERAEALAVRFEQAVADLSKAAEGCSDAQWQAKSGGGDWTVAATVHHVGSQFPLELEYLHASALSAPPPAHTWDDINGRNDARAKANNTVSKADALKTLRDGAATMAAFVRGLSDAQLDATAPLALAGNAEVNTQSLIEGGVLIDHAIGHLAEIRAAIA